MDADVVIVGFGPVGAAFANLLGARGIRTIVLERELDVYPLPRAAHIDHQGLRLLQEIGCLDQVLPDMIPNRRLDLVNVKRELLARVSADQPSVSGLPLSMYFYQPPFDRLLRDRAQDKPAVDVRLGTEVTGFSQDEKGVTVRCSGGDGTGRELRAAWLIGCDGARSRIREIAGIGQKSLKFEERWLVLDLLLKQPQPHLPLDHVLQVCDPARPYLSTPISRDRQRFEYMLLDGERTEDVTQPAFIEGLLKVWLDRASFEVTRAAVYTFQGLVAEKWREGRVLIAGDAAHLMPPFLGQGMCSGLRDVSNLAWKLDLMINRGASADLIDTYQVERSPHVTAIVEAAIRFGQVVCEVDPVRAEARDKALLSKDSPDRNRLSFGLPRLENGPLVLDGGGALFIQPQIAGRRLDDIVGARFLVVARDAPALGRAAGWWRALGALVVTADELGSDAVLAWLDRYGHDVVVVRPDRYVLGAGKSLDDLTERVKSVLAVNPLPESQYARLPNPVAHTASA
ncbi:MAG: bifunctional 3-(3-hydroxy-phenyl)propionate/3-hydroxycinnamic acid hydroxylase [Betaproteobacteria bacterium]